MNRLAFEDDEANTAPGTFLVIGGVGVGRHAIDIAQGREMRLEHETVAQFHRSDGERRQEQGELVMARRRVVAAVGRHEQLSTCLAHWHALFKVIDYAID